MMREKVWRLLRGLVLFDRSRLTTACPETSGSGEAGRFPLRLAVEPMLADQEQAYCAVPSGSELASTRQLPPHPCTAPTERRITLAICFAVYPSRFSSRKRLSSVSLHDFLTVF